MRRYLPIIALLLSDIALAADAPACPNPLRIGFHDSAIPPMLNGHGSSFEDPPGWQVEAVNDALQRLGCKAELLRLPSRRLSTWLVQGRIEFALFLGATPQRMSGMRFPLDGRGRPDASWAPLLGTLALFGRRGSTPDPAWNGSVLPAGTRVGVVSGSLQETVARERGWSIVPISTYDLAFGMLDANRFDLLLSPAPRETLLPEQRAGLVEWAPAAAQVPFFAPASPAIVRNRPAWVNDFWHGLCRAVRRYAPNARPVECGVKLLASP
ncbi:amino acid ABC transporter substrate-binding protein [Pelomonas sp. KK5]|uniref:amino acid ABC transporter substrate-binding protein n=1 Tax=Pelomonas sp. KK5 TaxID=1855730 RepID=UPI00117F510D|nr:amino acid ABC transporter substrate-binding protein [Pelomonas sp. KK5]